MRCSTHCSCLKFALRLVLGTAMLFAGWHLVFGTTVLTTEQVLQLEGAPTVAVVRSAFVEPDAADAPEASGTVERKAVAELGLSLHEAGLGERSMAVAWGMALVQLVGGAMLVLGLLTRLWATTAVLVLGLSFWAISVKAQGLFDMSPTAWSRHPAAFHGMYVQLFGVLAGLMLLRGGPGRWSLDHFLFGRSPNAEPAEGDA